jgi:hypothetical protein
MRDSAIQSWTLRPIVAIVRFMSSAPSASDQKPTLAGSTHADASTPTASMPGPEQLTLLQCHDVIGRLAAQTDDLRVQRRASERTRGAQKGHKGTSRAMLDEREVDQIIDCPRPRGLLAAS